MIDYKILLKKYIELVGYSEGATFTDCARLHVGAVFTQEEADELELLDFAPWTTPFNVTIDVTPYSHSS